MTEPVPPLASATPVPVQALAYSDPSGPRKPGLVVAIGVLGIVIASLSGIVNLIFAGAGFGRYQMARVFASYSATSAVTPSAVVAPNMGLKMGDATVVVNAVQVLIGLDGARVRELSNMMRSHGKDIFPIDDDKPITPEGVGGMIREHKPAGSSLDAAIFVTEEGRIEIYTDRVVFTSIDGNRKIETSAVKNSESDNASAAPATQPVDSTLTAAQVRRVMNAVKQAAQTPPTPAQLSTVQVQISAANQQLINPANLSVTQVTVIPQGAQGNVVMLQFEYGTLNIGTKGEVTSMSTYGPGMTASFSGPGFTPPKINIRGAFLMIGEAAASELLAVYLMIVALMVLRFSFSSPRLLRIYAWIKIPLALLAGVAVWMIEPGVENFGYAVLILALGAVYPIAVLIALRSRSVREFFTPMSAG